MKIYDTSFDVPHPAKQWDVTVWFYSDVYKLKAKIDDIKAEIDQWRIPLKAKSDVREDFGALRDCENNAVRPFAGCKKSIKV